MALTAKMVKFCIEYCIDNHATNAAIRAGYSEDTAYSIGSENLKKPEIQKFINSLQADSLKAAKITRDRVVNEFAKIAFADVRKVFDSDGRLKPVKELDKDTAAAISSIEVDELWTLGEDGKKPIGNTKKIKLSSKQAALDSLARLGGWNAPEKVAQTDTSGNDVQPTKPYSKEELISILKAANE
jgi:phage terminase small subunit